MFVLTPDPERLRDYQAYAAFRFNGRRSTDALKRARSSGYSELLVLDPQKGPEALAGLDRFLNGISHQGNTSCLDSVSLLIFAGR
jgi:hypothetical protein